MNKVLLDTHIFLWLLLDADHLSENTRTLITQAAQESTLCLSAISIWEIALLDKGRRIALQQPFRQWIGESLKTPGLELIELSVDILCESVDLPGSFHKDPADRMIVATARVNNLLLICTSLDLI